MLRRRHLGRVSFAEANDLQRALMQSSDDYIMIMEHPPTYTKGIRTSADSFKVDPASLDADVVDADRGGDVTYHGPGQIVAWPVITVPDDPSAGKDHVTMMEDAIIATVTMLDTDRVLGDVGRLEDYPGVWAHLEAGPVKIAAVGVRTKRNRQGLRRTLHGLALNVTTDMTAFEAIVPCGIPDKPVGSLTSLGLVVDYLEVEELLGQELAKRIGGEERVARVDRSVATTSEERPLIRRLRKAGVNPDEALPINTRKPEWLRIPAHMGQELSLIHISEPTRPY